MGGRGGGGRVGNSNFRAVRMMEREWRLGSGQSLGQQPQEFRTLQDRLVDLSGAGTGADAVDGDLLRGQLQRHDFAQSFAYAGDQRNLAFRA